MFEVPNIWITSHLYAQIDWKIGSIVHIYLYNALASTNEKASTENKVVIELLDLFYFFFSDWPIKAERTTVVVKKNTVQIISTKRSGKPSRRQFINPVPVWSTKTWKKFLLPSNSFFFPFTHMTLKLSRNSQGSCTVAVPPVCENINLRNQEAMSALGCLCFVVMTQVFSTFGVLCSVAQEGQGCPWILLCWALLVPHGSTWLQHLFR